MNVEVRQGPVTEASKAVFAEKYCKKGEGFREVCNRVAFALSDGPEHYHSFRAILMRMAFLPGGRIFANAGTSKSTTPYNCFVSGTIEDSLVSGPGSIMDRAKEAAATMRMGGGIGYDFSTLRPCGDLIRGLSSYSTGPISFMRIFNEICLSISSSGHRRGAQMGVMRVDHPDIEEFIMAKRDQTSFTGFNLSVAITDEFMEAVRDDAGFALRFDGRIYREVRARDLWEMIMRGTWDWAEPGVIFIDRINSENNLYYCERIAATNPCAEQPLPPHGACLLGSVNLTAYLEPTGTHLVGQPGYWLNLQGIERDIPDIVRAMDNVVDRATYPLEEQAQEAMMKRRMGIGITGVANAIEACGHPFGSPGFVQMCRDVMMVLRNSAYGASVELAEEKGPFPLFDRDQYMNGKFVGRLPDWLKDGIYKHGIRNSHLISIAPTGTISFCADNISSGIEPVYSVKSRRRVRMSGGEQVMDVEDYGSKFLGVVPKTTDEVTVQEHLDVLTACQEYVDSAISKTCNVGGDVSWEDFKGIYFQAWEKGAKGCTTFRAAGKRFGIIEAVQDCQGGSCSAS